MPLLMRGLFDLAVSGTSDGKRKLLNASEGTVGSGSWIGSANVAPLPFSAVAGERDSARRLNAAWVALAEGEESGGLSSREVTPIRWQ